MSEQNVRGVCFHNEEHTTTGYMPRTPVISVHNNHRLLPTSIDAGYEKGFDESLGMKTDMGKLMQGCVKSFVEHKWFDLSVLLVVGAYIALLFAETLYVPDCMHTGVSGNTQNEVHASVCAIGQVINLVAVGVFMCESILRLTAYGNGYIKQPWNVFDWITLCVTLGLSLYDYVSEETDTSSLYIRQTLRCLQLVIVLRRVSSSKNIYIRLKSDRQHKNIHTHTHIRSHLERVNELLNILCTNEYVHPETRKEIQWSIKIITSQRLYEPIVCVRRFGFDSNALNAEEGAWIKTATEQSLTHTRTNSVSSRKGVLRKAHTHAANQAVINMRRFSASRLLAHLQTGILAGSSVSVMTPHLTNAPDSSSMQTERRHKDSSDSHMHHLQVHTRDEAVMQLPSPLQNSSTDNDPQTQHIHSSVAEETHNLNSTNTHVTTNVISDRQTGTLVDTESHTTPKSTSLSPTMQIRQHTGISIHSVTPTPKGKGRSGGAMMSYAHIHAPFHPHTHTQPQTQTQTQIHGSPHTNILTYQRWSVEASLLLTDKLCEWNFPISILNNETQGDALVAVTYKVLDDLDIYQHFNFDVLSVCSYVAEIQNGYMPTNPYHNHVHAADVTHSTYWLLTSGGLLEHAKLTYTQTFSAIFAAVIHDFKHPGFNNNFLTQTSDIIALRYNDSSVLENYHVSEAFQLLRFTPCNFMHNVDKITFKEFRQCVIECVLATDMSRHFKDLSNLKTRLHSQDFLQNESLALDQQMLLNVCVHAADVSNPAKQLRTYLWWTERVMEEFFIQGDKEKSQYLEVSMFYDRYTTNIAKCQIGFIDIVVRPLFDTIHALLPPTEKCVSNLNFNYDWWKTKTAESDEIVVHNDGRKMRFSNIDKSDAQPCDFKITLAHTPIPIVQHTEVNMRKLSRADTRRSSWPRLVRSPSLQSPN